MTLLLNIQGDLEHAAKEAEEAIHKAFDELCELLKQNNVSHSASLSTPVLPGKTASFTAVAPAPAAEQPSPAEPAAAAPAASDAPAEEPAAEQPAAGDAPAAGSTEDPAAS